MCVQLSARICWDEVRRHRAVSSESFSVGGVAAPQTDFEARVEGALELLEAAAILLLPTSITSSFDFPFWRVPKLTSLASGVRSNGILRNAGDLLPAGLQESSTRSPKT